MYQSQLLDAYKKAQNYIQDKQIAHDLNLPRQRIGEMRKGLRYISDEEAVFLAEQAGIDPELALLGCHADRNENPRIKQLWEHIAKKHNGLGLRTISMGCGALALMVSTKTEAILQCALCILC
ncbi:DUF3693 domain-containing protein [Vibrio anguillarum]|uniref:DUF3693 domain-containing protein n=1 Tax=Vibrio anguillarum TaxID=55601 RepID=UPI0016A393D0|nr:DUF3693 domain-containing protein [Vibrio anguillarum]MBF4255315.1 hypothetical protein [Vibrio anguillarum]MBF4438881.1 hypothetical protein [Vibrio anguillarum]MCC4238467.1 DUF3693 domain-containing protein [Vibrio anguillarum]NOI06916.1 hypothetical protein [Vibrio anguillarum]